MLDNLEENMEPEVKKDGRGGARPNAGRKKKTLNTMILEQLRKSSKYSKMCPTKPPTSATPFCFTRSTNCK